MCVFLLEMWGKMLWFFVVVLRWFFYAVIEWLLGHEFNVLFRGLFEGIERRSLVVWYSGMRRGLTWLYLAWLCRGIVARGDPSESRG